MPRRILTGKVVSHKMNKTAMVRVERIARHPLYKKDLVIYKKYPAHDENNQYLEGAEVYIRESRPISKTKCWEVIGTVSGGVR